ncbi:MAG: hypothetical protein CMJ83_10640 [Planctomycetes bacterium]|nr:hypothetical protein [Planctomycetota bacterium]
MSGFFTDLDRVVVGPDAALSGGFERHLATLADLGHDMAASSDLDEMVRVLLVRVIDLVDADRGMLLLTDGEPDTGRVFKGVDALGEPLLSEDLHYDRGIVRRLLRDHGVALEAGDDAPSTIAAVALRGAHGPFGVLYIDRSDATRAFDADVSLLLQLVAAQAAPAFELHRHDEERRRSERVSMENEFLRRLSRRQAEQSRVVETLNEKLSETSTFLESILESSTEHALVATDVAGRITTFNTGASRIYGWTKSETEGRKRLDVLFRDSDRSTGLLDEMIQATSGPGGFSVDTVRRTKAGAKFTAQVGFTAIRDGDGEVVGYLDVSKDVTDQQRMRRQLLLSEKMASLGTLAAGVAHEFNNQLQGITGFLSHALSSDDPATWRRAMQVGLDAANRAATLTGRLQAFARPNVTGRQPTDLGDLVEETCALVERSFATEGVTLVQHHDEDAPRACADRSRISQVLLNLLTNARHAVFETDTRRVEVRVAADGDEHVRLSVTDTGCGITEESQSRIFEPFFTTKGALGGSVYDGKVSGTGLGLAISSGIVQEHDGRIEVESRMGEGTTFHVVLPRADQDAPSASPAPAPQAVEVGAGAVGRLAVLVVDDDPVVRAFLAEVLQARGHVVTAAESGADGLRAFGEGVFDVVVADYKMPGMNGGRFFREVASRSSGAVRRILITGCPDEESAVARPEADDTLQKPFRDVAIIKAVESTLRQTRCPEPELRGPGAGC